MTLGSSRSKIPIVSARVLAVAVASVALFALSACGGNEEPADSCTNKICEYGVCLPESGECVNAGICEPVPEDRIKQSQCLEGFACNDGVCEADYPCSDENPCTRGVCSHGACIDAEHCTTRADCMPGNGCSESGVCRNLCEDKHCGRGVCNPETGKCLNPQTCAPGDRSVASCLEGYKCLTQTEGPNRCLEEEAYCERLDCQRGRCSFELERCVDRETCQADADCAVGNYCNIEIGECQNNVCNESQTDCPRGECAPETGQCVNPDSCSNSDQCLPDHLCVEGRCVPSDEACGPDGCPGNQACNYAAETLSAECEEAAGVACRNAVDCRGNSVCRDGDCIPPSQCQPDQFEPNDSTQVAFTQAATDKTVSASLCRNDVDRFEFDSSLARGEVVRGTMFVELAIEPIDVGQGSATLTVTDASGTILGRQSTGPRGRLHIGRQLGASDFDTFHFKVSGQNLNQAGLRYSLTADIAPESVVQTCTRASAIPNNQPGGIGGSVIGHTGDATSEEMQGSCVPNADEIAESVYTFNLKQTSYVTVEVVPQESVDLALSLRRRCASGGTEITCRDEDGSFRPESTGRLLPPDTYTVVVEGTRLGEAGQFLLRYNAEPVICSPAQNRCTGSSSALVCRDNRTTFNEIGCANGCNSEIGRCNRPAGDTCYEAISVEGSHEDEELNWQEFSNTFEPRSGCVGGSDNTDGGDRVYELTVPAGEVVDAQMNVGSEDVSGALYLSGNCEDPGNTCVASSDTDSPSEHLVYKNESSSSETLYLVADSVRQASNPGSVEIQVGPQICEPDSATCNGSTRRRCSQSGIEYIHTSCAFGCTDGECNSPPFDTCSGAYDLSGGGSVTHDWAALSTDYNPPTQCVGSSMPGEDAVYSVELASDEVLSVDVTPQAQDGDPAVYITSQCGSINDVEMSCLTGVDDGFGGDSESVMFTPEATYSGKRTFYVVVDSDDTTGGFSGANGRYTIHATINQSNCTPGDTRCAASSNDTIEICGEFGLQYSSFTCQGSPASCQPGNSTTPATCAAPSGEVCADPIVVGKNETITRDGGTSDGLSPGSGLVGECQLTSEMDGADRFHQVELSAGDLLTAELSSTESQAHMYVVDNCVLESSCQATTDAPAENQTLYYFAEEDETIFLVVDSTDAGSFSDNYTLELSTTPNATCRPETFSCTGPNQVSECNSVGSGYQSQLSCSNGCQNGACNPPGGSPPPQASCSTAPDVGDGTVIVDNWGNYSNNLDVSGSCGLSTTADGSEAVYAVDVVPGEIVTASLDELSDRGEDPILYLLGGCTTPASSCVTSDFATSGEASFTYTATSNTTLYVVADNDWSGANSSDFRLDIRKQTPTCSPGTVSCTSNNQGISYCKANGLSGTYACNGECSMGACLNPTGNRCIDPIELTNGDSFSSSFSAYENTLAPTSGQCGILTGTPTPNGPEAIFEVTGYSQGETLTARLDWAPDAVNMYVLEPCPYEEPKPANTCEYGVSGQRELEYRLDSSGPVYLAVDAQQSDEEGDFTISLGKETGDTCQPGGGTCAGDQLSVCSDTGNGIEETYQCGIACKASGYCERPSTPNDTCINAHPVDGGTRLVDDFDRFSTDLDPTCVTDNSSGRDAVYSVSVPAGEAVQAKVEPLAGGAELGAYFLDTCSSTGSTCLAEDSVDNASFQKRSVTTGYQNTSNQNEVVYLVVDEGGGRAVPFELTVTVSTPECSPNPGNQPTTCLNPETEGVCTNYGLFESNHCFFGCDSGTGGCEPPTNETCGGAIPVSQDNTYTADIGAYSGDYDVSATSMGVSSCVSSGASAGPDAIYKVQLDTGDYFDATLESPGDAVLWVTSDCTNAADSCVAGSNSGDGSESVSFLASSSGTYYIIADTNTASGQPQNPSGEYTLLVDFAGPALCVPGTRECSAQNGDAIEYCTGPSEQISAVCTGTCSNGECTQLHGDFCEDAQQASNNTTDTFSYPSYNDDYNLSFNACVGFSTAGPEKVYEVQLDPNETLDVTANSSNFSDNIQAYVTTACGDTSTLENSCVIGNDFFGPSGTLTFSPSISETTTYFVVVDSWVGVSQPSGNVTVDFTIQ